MPSYSTMRVESKSVPTRRIGDAVMAVLASLPPGAEVIYSTPAMLSYFGQMPKRYEVTAIDLVIRTGG